jgi:hypothetical protein
VASALLCTSCGGASRPGDRPPAAPVVAADAETAPPAPVPHPFAKTAFEAEIAIRKEIHARNKALWDCVDDYRGRIGQRHQVVEVDIGIDQEGGLLGVIDTDHKHGSIEGTLKACMIGVLRSAPYPSSHAGVINVRWKFADAGY